jgi:hypothetical protein
MMHESLENIITYAILVILCQCFQNPPIYQLLYILLSSSLHFRKYEIAPSFLNYSLL